MVSFDGPAQDMPPNAGSTSTVLNLVFIPPPHGLEHADHLLNDVHVQLTETGITML